MAAASYHLYDSVLVQQRLARWPLFDPAYYLHLHGDIHGGAAQAVDHFATYGCWEGRRFTSELRLAAHLTNVGKPAAAGPVALAPATFAALVADADIGIYASSKSNFFMREIAAILAGGLRHLGLKVTEGDEETLPEQRRPHTIIVAPHEFFSLGKGVAWRRDDVVSSCVLLSTEQPQTQWFGASLPYLLACRGILEMCWQTSQTFADAGIHSCFYVPGLPLTWVFGDGDLTPVLQNSLIQSLPQAALDFEATEGPLSERPLDVTFMATDSPVRDEFLGRHIALFRDLQTLLIYRRRGRSVPAAYAADAEIGKVNNFLLQRTKILLNIHRDGLGYFEIHRMGMQGMWNKCAVVTNKCFPHPYFIPNEHYFEETLDRIPKLISWLIKTPEGRREAEIVRGNAIKRYATLGSARQQSLRVADLLGKCFQLGASRL